MKNRKIPKYVCTTHTLMIIYENVILQFMMPFVWCHCAYSVHVCLFPGVRLHEIFHNPNLFLKEKKNKKNHNERKLVTHLRYAPATEFSFYRSKKGRSIDTRWQAGVEEFYLKSFLPPASIGVAGSWVIPQNVDEVAQFVSWVVSAPFFGGLAPTYMTKFVTYSRGARTLLRA